MLENRKRKKDKKVKLNTYFKIYVFCRSRFEYFKRWFIQLLWRIVIPKTGGARLYELISTFIDQMMNSSITLSASAMAFNFFLAVFPAFIFVFSLIPYIPIDNLEQSINIWIAKALPSTAVGLISSVMKELFIGKGIGVVSISFLVVIYSSTRGLNTMIEAFRKMDPKFTPQLDFLPQYARAFALLLTLFFMTIIAIGANVFVTILLNNVFNLFEPIKGFQRFAIQLLEQIAEVLAVFVTISVVYTAAKANRIRVGFVSAGSVASSLLMMLAIGALKWLFSSFFNYNKFYGSLATVIVFMVWFYWVSIVLLLGYNLNVALRNITHNRSEKNKKEEFLEFSEV